MRRVAFLPAAALMAHVGLVHAESSPAPSGLDLSSGIAETKPPPEGQGTYVHTFGELMLGKGLRLNNPFRLATPVGDEPDGLSFTAYYLDLGIGAAFGPPAGLEHGAEVSLSIATDGIAQQVMSLSYVALYPITPQALVRGRAGMPIVFGPDANVGMELAAGGAWLFTGGLGVSAELVGSLFYGAATEDKSQTAVPVLSLELGVWLDHEVLP
jgi:hypothetical protein